MQGQRRRADGRRCRDYPNQSINQTSQNQTPEKRGNLDPGDTNLLFTEGSSEFPASLLPPSFPRGSLEAHLSLFQHTLPTFQAHLFFHCVWNLIGPYMVDCFFESFIKSFVKCLTTL